MYEYAIKSKFTFGDMVKVKVNSETGVVIAIGLTKTDTIINVATLKNSEWYQESALILYEFRKEENKDD